MSEYEASKLHLTIMRIPDRIHPVNREQQRQLVIFKEAKAIFQNSWLRRCFVVSQIHMINFSGKRKKPVINFIYRMEKKTWQLTNKSFCSLYTIKYYCAVARWKTGQIVKCCMFYWGAKIAPSHAWFLLSPQVQNHHYPAVAKRS